MSAGRSGPTIDPRRIKARPTASAANAANECSVAPEVVGGHVHALALTLVGEVTNPGTRFSAVGIICCDRASVLTEPFMSGSI
jgi:hypothetical protein